MTETRMDKQINDIFQMLLHSIKENTNSRLFDNIFGDDSFELKSLEGNKAIFVTDASSTAKIIKDNYLSLIQSSLNEITQSDLAKLAEGGHEEVILYNGNVCYYYTTEIKHFDNGMPNELGNMEYAIMRNNIYSLAVTSINEIGKPIVDPTPDTPNESTKAALNVEAKILPWIVRYNDIEF